MYCGEMIGKREGGAEGWGKGEREGKGEEGRGVEEGGGGVK